jgi:hypothetical protein
MRKSVILSICSMLLLITGALNTAFAQELTNYVIDPGFEMETAFTLEEGGPGWNYVIERAFLDDIYPRSGDWCGALEEIPLDGDYLTSQYHQHIKGLTPGATYLCTCFGRLDWYTETGNEWGIYLGVQYFDYEQILENKVATTTFSTEYAPIILQFTMGDTNTSADIWTWKSYGAEAQSDDWGVWDYHNFVTNHSLEDGDFTGWNYWGDPTTYNSSIDDTEPLVGTYCGRIGDGEGGFAQLLTNLVPGATYGLHASAKVANAGDVAYFGVKHYDATREDEELSAEVTETDYYEANIAFTMGPEDTEAEIYFWKGAGNGPAYIDSFLVCQMVVPEEASDINEQIECIVPETFVLEQNYPNPFNLSTMINYQLPISGEVELTVYNQLGQNVVTLVVGKQVVGTYTAKWDATDFSSGIYFYQLTVYGKEQTYSDTKKMILLK